MRRRGRIEGMNGRVALSERELDTVLAQFAGMRVRLRTLVTHDVTQDDILATFIKPQHRGLLTNAATIVEGTRRFNTSLGGLFESGVTIDILIKDKPKFLLPKYAGGHCEPSEGAEKLKTFAQELLQFMQEYHIGEDAIKALNYRCNNLAQMRFFLKSLPALGVECEYKVPSNMPDIPKELRDALRGVDEFVARASMLHKNVRLEEKEVELGMSGVVRVPCPWSPNNTIGYYL